MRETFLHTRVSKNVQFILLIPKRVGSCENCIVVKISIWQIFKNILTYTTPRNVRSRWNKPQVRGNEKNIYQFH